MYYPAPTYEAPFGYIEIVSRTPTSDQGHTQIEFRAILTTPLKRTKRRSFAPSGYKTGQSAEAVDSGGTEYLIFFAPKRVGYAVYKKTATLSELDFLFHFQRERGVDMFEWQKTSVNSRDLHRSHAPAKVCASDAPNLYTFIPGQIWIKGAFYTEEHYLDGKLHRPDGPAIIVLSEDNGWLEFWFTKGNPVNKDEIAEIFGRHEQNPDWRQWTDAEKMIMQFALS